jgi:mannose-6-phosphate isomerase-like protein (cupin superfamily)
MKLILAVLLAAGFAFPAGDPAGFYYWKASELKGFAKTLGAKLGDKHVASEHLVANGNYSFMVVHRNGTAEAEFHATQADIMVVQSGEATLIYGGSMVDGKTTAPNEIRGPSIKNGVEKKIAAGDIATVPAKTPHQVNVAPGKEITYFVVKVTQ